MSSYVADFETTTTPDDCRVWLWGIVPIDNINEFSHGTTIESFVEHMLTIKGETYFHNLAFDGSFLLDYLLKNGWTYSPKPAEGKREISTLIDAMGKFYQITVHHENGGMVFKDSYKKLPMTVAAVAGAFNLNMSKGDIDFDAPRPVGYTPTAEELSYVYRDVAIVAQALQIQHDSGLTRLTVGADALAAHKELVQSHHKWFPTLPLYIDTDIRQAYRGGYTYVRADRQNTIVGEGSVYDVNSLYPHIMYSRMLPWGWPEFFSGPPRPTARLPLWIAQVEIVAELKPDHLPTIQLKNTPGYSPTEYLSDITEPVSLHVSSVDWSLINDHYNVEVLSWGGGYRFRQRDDLFRSYIDHWGAIKESSTGGMRTLAKLMLNSLYGKYATNPDVTGRYPTIENNMLKLVMGPQEYRDPVYTAAGVFITSWARDLTIRAAQALYDRFIYADTDSLHLLGHEPPEGLDVHDARMGAWAHEYDFTRARFVRAKCYAEELPDGSTLTRIAGLPERGRTGITVDTLRVGESFPGKLRPKRVPGGVVLESVDFQIRG